MCHASLMYRSSPKWQPPCPAAQGPTSGRSPSLCGTAAGNIPGSAVDSSAVGLPAIGVMLPNLSPIQYFVTCGWLEYMYVYIYIFLNLSIVNVWHNKLVWMLDRQQTKLEQVGNLDIQWQSSADSPKHLPPSTVPLSNYEAFKDEAFLPEKAQLKIDPSILHSMSMAFDSRYSRHTDAYRTPLNSPSLAMLRPEYCCPLAICFHFTWPRKLTAVVVCVSQQPLWAQVLVASQRLVWCWQIPLLNISLVLVYRKCK